MWISKSRHNPYTFIVLAILAIANIQFIILSTPVNPSSPASTSPSSPLLNMPDSTPEEIEDAYPCSPQTDSASW